MKHVKSVLILSICIAICYAKTWTPEQKEAIREKLKSAAEELKQKIENAKVKWNDYLAKHKTAPDFEKKPPDPRSLSDSLEKFINGVKELDAVRDQKKAEEKQAKMELIEQVAPFIKQEYDRIAAKIKEKQDAKVSEALEAWNEMQQLATDVANIIKTEHEKKKAEKKEAWDKFKENVFGITPKPAAANAVQPAVRNAFLDDVTGTAPYKTWTWILLVICLVIGVLLVVAIIYHVTRPMAHYQRLHGSDHAHHSHAPDEFTPFAPKKSLVETPVKKLSASRQLPHTDISQSRPEVPFPLRTETKTAAAQPQKDNISSSASATSPKFSPPKIKPNFVGHEAIPEDEEPAQPIEEKHEDQHLAQHGEQHKKADDLSVNQDPSATIPAPSDAIVSGGYDPVQIQNPPETNTKQHDDQAEVHPQVEEPVKSENETQQNDNERTEEPHEPHEIHHQQQTEEDEQKPKEESDT